ncbi:hypothetical protein HYDPIDRAFT_27294 [Hydnomerulius pinastri MD-312]|nr:hypothetical protein HYDPIDRAFT_27294 [Hydnomerulius pinastri MD-312]
MGNHPSILFPTPEERAEYQFNNRVEQPRRLAPPGYIRVQMYPSWKEGSDEGHLNMRWNSIKADFPLEPSGELSLARIKWKWSLENCAAIDPARHMKFAASNPDYLSPLALAVLTDEHGVLNVFEPKPSDETIAMREQRRHLLKKYDAAVARLEAATIGRLAEAWGVTGTVKSPGILLTSLGLKPLQALLIVFIIFLMPSTLGYYFFIQKQRLTTVMLPRSW